jgi:uncharacterized protein (DUF58 family)
VLKAKRQKLTANRQKPTGRAVILLIGAVVVYFFANQTQVGWLYVMSAALAGVVLASGWMNRGMLKRIEGDRMLGDLDNADLYEGDEVKITFTLHNVGVSGAAQLRLTELCLLAAPDSPQRAMPIFVPSLPERSSARFEYMVTLDRRGVYQFPPLPLETRAPFGFFASRRALDVPTGTLVYPEVRPLRRLDLLDRQLAPQVARPSAGIGYEVMGVRPYRPGDSPRHIHWRSVARTGQLISKEFADETQPGLILALDLYRHPYTETDSKHTPFEWAVKAVASIGDYALRRGYPLSLVGNDDALPVPPGAVGREALLQYLARVQPIGKRTLAGALAQPTQAFVAVVLPYPDESILSVLAGLRQRGQHVLAVLFDSASFPAGGVEARHLAGELRAAGVETRVIAHGSDWAAQLSEVVQEARA